jgi:hypothetical protein
LKKIETAKKGGNLMKQTNWRPFIMFGLMIGVMFFIGLAFLAMMFARSGDVGPRIPSGGWWPGMWGLGPFMMIFPCFGLIVMVFMAFFFFRMMAGGGGPMSGMMGHGGPMSGMMGHSHDPQARSQSSRDEPQGICPSCESPVQSGWKMCPHCGQELV